MESPSSRRCPNCYHVFSGPRDFCTNTCEEQLFKVRRPNTMDKVAAHCVQLFPMYKRREALMRALKFYGYEVTSPNMSALGKALAARKKAKKNKISDKQLKLF